METKNLFDKYLLGKAVLKNRIVMAPMTRSRAEGNIPNELMVKYYSQRSGAGLIITEGTSPSKNGLGYSRIPGIFSDEQVKGWKAVTEAVHSNGSKIFVQLMHTGRVSVKLNMPEGADILAPSQVKVSGQTWTDSKGMQDYDMPKEMTLDDIKMTKDEYVKASINAIKAGFDGVELHGANGYLLEQFLSPVSNQRIDEYGGSIENRCRFVLEVTEAVAKEIGKDRLGIRLSPYGVFNDMPHYPEIDETYKYLVSELNKIGIIYIHLVDHSSMGAPEVPSSINGTIRSTFENTVIRSGGFTKERAQEVLNSENADLIAFGRPFINNPDLAERFAKDLELSSELDMNTFYTPGEKGYTDYPVYSG